MATWNIFCAKQLTDRYLSQYLPNQFGPWTWVQPILNGSQSWSLQSYASSGNQSVTSCWAVIMSGSQSLVSGLWRTGERLGRGLCCQEELAGLWNIPFAEGNEEIPAVLCFSHRSTTSLQTTESSYRYRPNRLQASNVPLGRKDTMVIAWLRSSRKWCKSL